MSNASKIAEAAANFACGIYKNMPDALVPNPAADVLHSIWDGLCGDPPKSPADLPPPPTKQFDGGQCCDIEYKVVVKFVFKDGRPDQISTLFASYQGTILGLQYQYVTSGSDRLIIVVLSWKKCDGRVLTETIANDGKEQSFTC